MFPSNGDPVITPKGHRAIVVDDKDRSSIQVQRKIEGGLYPESYPAEELKPAPKPSDAELTKRAAENVERGIKEGTKAFVQSSTQKTVRKHKSGETTLQDAEKKDQESGGK